MKSIVVAYDLNRGIGANNDLLWQRDLPADLAHFKQITSGGTVLMGLNTYESIGRALPGRQNIVVSHKPIDIPGVTVVNSLEDAYKAAKGEIFIIGGGSIYAQTIDDADKIYATEVQLTFPQATVFFPAMTGDWREISREHNQSDDKNKYAYDFVIYERS
nr:Dihydrofolate reductase [uncultured bacterium]